MLEVEPPAYSRGTSTPFRRKAPMAPVPMPNKLAAAATPAVIIGTLVGFTEARAPLVDFPGNQSGAALSARSMIALSQLDAGCEIALAFEQGNPAKPMVMGRLQLDGGESAADPVNVTLDGEQVTLSARNEIVLRCGKASITLTRAGKIIIRGAYLLSRSSGVNRIKGGSVQIN